MDINSTEKERYDELKDKILTITKWNTSKENELEVLDNEKPLQTTKRLANLFKITNRDFYLEGYNNPVKITARAIKESYHHNSSHSTDLRKLFTCIDDVLNNAVLIDIEEYRHKTRNKSSDIKQDNQYLSAFFDERKIYPVKITLEIHKNDNNTNIYVIITVGTIPIKKEESSSLRVHPIGESVVGEATSFNISITEFAKYFNNNQRKLLKNLPDDMLNKEQKDIKYKTKEHDEIKNKKIEILNNKKNEIINKIQSITYTDEIDEENIDEDFDI